MKFKTGDKVIVIAGKNKGNTGRISRVLPKENKVVIEGINIVKKHVKPSANNQSGGIVDIEAPLHMSNIMFINEKTNKRSRKVIHESKKIDPKDKKAAPKKAKAKKEK